MCNTLWDEVKRCIIQRGGEIEDGVVRIFDQECPESMVRDFTESYEKGKRFCDNRMILGLGPIVSGLAELRKWREATERAVQETRDELEMFIGRELTKIDVDDLFGIELFFGKDSIAISSDEQLAINVWDNER